MVKGSISRKEDVNKAMCRNTTKKNRTRYISMKNKAEKAVPKAMRENTEKCSNGLLSERIKN